jgi:hypothetical protein
MSTRGVDRAGLAALLPVRADAAPTLAQLLEGLGSPSPFARIERTHFARLLLMPLLLDADGDELSSLPRCLLFAAEFDGSAGGYVESVCQLMGEEAQAIFDHCEDFPGVCRPVAVRSWLFAHRVRAGFSLHGHPGATVAEVRASLRLREQLIAFALATRSVDPAAFARYWAARPWRR